MINTVSLCMVTYNEAHRIYETLSRAEPYVDEIVVVDQASTDDTTLEVLRFGEDNPHIPVIVVYDKHYGFCEPSRKRAHDNSSGEWVLVLDADERISDTFALNMRDLDRDGHLGVRMKRSLWLSGAHHFTGDYQYRFFKRNAVRYLDEMHTEPQPVPHESAIWSPPYVSIWHEKTWSEQVRDEMAYESLIRDDDFNAEAKRNLNVHLRLLEEKGLSVEEVEALSEEERAEMFGLVPFEREQWQ